MNKHDIIYRRHADQTWISQTQIDALDAVVAEHGKTWRKLVETRWYNGSNRDIGVEVYCIRNNPGQCYKALDLYTEIKSGKAKVERFIRVSGSKTIHEAALIDAGGGCRYTAVGYDGEGRQIGFASLGTLEDVADWTRVLDEAFKPHSVFGRAASAALVDRSGMTVVEAFDVASQTAVS